MKSLFVLLLILTSCAHKKDATESLELWNSFAFVHEGRDYFFGRKTVKEGNKKCTSFVGFRDGERTYTFPATRLSDLNQIYDSRITVNQKMSEAVRKFEKWNGEETNKDCLPIESTSEVVLTLIVYSPFIAIAAPLWIPEVIGDALDTIPGQMDKLRLHMTFEEVSQLLSGESFVVRNDEFGTFYVFDHKRERLVMNFENGKLRAWVRGLNP